MKVKAIREFNSTAGNAKIGTIMDVDRETAEFWAERGFAEIVEPGYAPADEPDVPADDDQTDA